MTMPPPESYDNESPESVLMAATATAPSPSIVWGAIARDVKGRRPTVPAEAAWKDAVVAARRGTLDGFTVAYEAWLDHIVTTEVDKRLTLEARQAALLSQIEAEAALVTAEQADRRQHRADRDAARARLDAVLDKYRATGIAFASLPSYQKDEVNQARTELAAIEARVGLPGGRNPDRLRSLVAEFETNGRKLAAYQAGTTRKGK